MKSCVTISLVDEARGGPFVFWDDLDEACAQAHALGFDAVEIFAPSAAAIDAKLLQRRLGGLNLKLAALGTGAGWVKHKLHLALPNASQRKEAQDFIRPLIELGGMFGAPVIIGSMQGRSGVGADRSTARGYLAEGLAELAAFASQAGTVLLYEPLNRYETDQTNTIADALSLLAETGAPNIQLLCDLFHMNIEEADLAEALVLAGDRIGHVHFADSNRRPVGCGHLQLAPAIASLRAMNYEGYLSAEVFPYPSSVEAARLTMNAFKYYCGRLS